MPQTPVIIIVGTALMLALGLIIIMITMAYQKKQLQHQQHILRMETDFRQETLKAQLEVQEQTFLSFSQELHDNIGQLLLLARLQLGVSVESTAQASKVFFKSRGTLDLAMDEVRALSRRYNSLYIHQQELPALLEAHVELIRQAGTHRVDLQVEGAVQLLPSEKKLLLFRIVQEALSNVLRHARARSVTILLRYAGNSLHLRIKDDGRGFEKSPIAAGTGIHNMRNRAQLIGARLRMESEPGAGTLIFIDLPLT